jgi:hypothetical protein
VIGNYDHKQLTINLEPHCGPCYDFCNLNYHSKRTVWLVPHVIKNREDSNVITWRCNWGNTCESACIYAMAKERDKQPADI